MQLLCLYVPGLLVQVQHLLVQVQVYTISDVTMIRDFLCISVPQRSSLEPLLNQRP